MGRIDRRRNRGILDIFCTFYIKNALSVPLEQRGKPVSQG
jgi:hypothetical protein